MRRIWRLADIGWFWECWLGQSLIESRVDWRVGEEVGIDCFIRGRKRKGKVGVWKKARGRED